MAGLSTGTIPPYYREVFDLLCPGKETNIDHEVWKVCMKSATLPDAVIEQIWEHCDPSSTGHVSRDAFYRSLALCALAQQGKAVDEKSLVLYGEAELPSPTLASMSELRSSCMKILRKTRPTELGYSYEELKAMDDVSVNLLPEKKGMVFKHVEYLVESRVFKSSVRRRYKDFEALYELLVTKYPYRLIPRLPPKKLNNLSAAFIEQRRRALKRFLLLVVRHPVLSKDDITKIFLSAGGQDVGAKLKDKFKTPHDEYTFNPYAKKVEELVSDATRVKYDRVREQINVMHQVVSSMLHIAQNMESRSMALCSDMKQFAANMTTLSTDSLLMSSWTSGGDETWSYMQRDFGSLSSVFKSISDKAHQQGRRETSGFTESVHQFLDLIVSYEDLCERRERTVRKHQKALGKVQTMVKHKERIESTGGHMSEREDSTIIRRDDELIQIEKRNFFSLFCLDLEAQLIHANLAQLVEVFKSLASAQVKGQAEYLSVWDELKTVVDGMGMVKASSPTSATSPTRPALHAEDTRSPFV